MKQSEQGHATIASLGNIMQMAFVPRNFDAELQRWLRFGAGPFFLLEHIAADEVLYRSERVDLDFTLAIGYWGEMQIELVRQHNQAPSIYRRFIDEGRDGLHHICLLTDDMAHARRICAAAGASIEQEIRVQDGEAIYADCGAGPLIEIAHFGPTLLGGFAQMREAARHWNGGNPLRRLA